MNQGFRTAAGLVVIEGRAGRALVEVALVRVLIQLGRQGGNVKTKQPTSHHGNARNHIDIADLEHLAECKTRGDEKKEMRNGRVARVESIAEYTNMYIYIYMHTRGVKRSRDMIHSHGSFYPLLNIVDDRASRLSLRLDRQWDKTTTDSIPCHGTGPRHSFSVTSLACQCYPFSQSDCNVCIESSLLSMSLVDAEHSDDRPSARTAQLKATLDHGVRIPRNTGVRMWRDGTVWRPIGDVLMLILRLEADSDVKRSMAA